MKRLILLLSVLYSVSASAQLPKTELYNLLKKLLNDSTGYSNIGDWAVGEPKKFPVKWKEHRIIMSDDTAINFYRLGNADISIKGRAFRDALKQPVKWTIMLKGPRAGYTSFSIISTPSRELSPRLTCDSLLGNTSFKAKLIKSCDNKDMTGYYYYEIKLPKKDPAFIKFSWFSLNGNTAIRIDGYDDFSKYAVKLDCPK